MIDADSFEMIETISSDALARHPVWAPYDEADRPTILAWGVSTGMLDAELARYEFCGPEPLFPVLVLDRPPTKQHLIVAASFQTARGPELKGYVMRPHVFGIYIDAAEFCFNLNLPDSSARAAARLGRALDTDADQLFPLRYTTELRAADGSEVAGEFDRFW